MMACDIMVGFVHGMGEVADRISETESVLYGYGSGEAMYGSEF